MSRGRVTKAHRDLQKMVRREARALGCRAVSFDYSTTHPHATIDVDGKERLLVMHGTPSCHRANKNLIASLRRLVRETREG